MMIVDANVSTFIVLVSNLVKVKLKGLFWMLKNDPRNPINSFLIRRKSDRIARELIEEFKKELDK
jgi:hypothetical protein